MIFFLINNSYEVIHYIILLESTLSHSYFVFSWRKGKEKNIISDVEITSFKIILSSQP